MKEAASVGGLLVDQSYCFAFALPFWPTAVWGGVGRLSVHTPPEQLPLPFIRFAEASVVKTGAGIDKVSTASKRAAKAVAIHFIVFLPKSEFGHNTRLGGVP
jgi:hypothetical protein